MKTNLKLHVLGPLLCLIFICSCATKVAVRPQLPAEMPLNPEAGRGGWWIVTLHSEDGEELPFMVDSGTTDTLIDESLASKLGKSLGHVVFQSWGVKETHDVYAAPKLYLGNAALIFTRSGIATYDCKPLSAAAGRRIMGILGYDCLRHYCIQLDFAAGKMRFLNDEHADVQNWGKAFPIVPLNDRDQRPAVAQNILGAQGPHSLIDSGCNFDGWLMPKYFQQWTNSAVPPEQGMARSPAGMFGGEKYPSVAVQMKNVESDGIGLRLLSRNLVTFDFPKHTLYLRRQSARPLPDSRLRSTPMEVLDALVADVIQEDAGASSLELARIEQGNATEQEKAVARELVATLQNNPKPTPAEVPATIVELPLGDARPESAEVGWLKPMANRIPLNGEIASPLLDSGKIYATGLFAHAPSKYVYNLNGQWQTLRGEAGLHTAWQGHAYGVIFIIKADGQEVFRSDIIHGTEHPRYEVDVTGVKMIELSVEKATAENGGNWGLWLAPTLYRKHL